MINEILFWSHLAIIAFALSIGFFLPLPIVVFLVLAHRIHVYLFNGCAFSRLQKKAGTLPSDVAFLQNVCKRLLKINLNLRQSKVLDYTIVSIPVSVSFLIFYL